MSGGDQHFIKLLNHLARQNSVSVCLPAGSYRKEFSSRIKRLEYFNPPGSAFIYRFNFVLFWLYIWRIVRSVIVVWTTGHDLIITSSHLFFDSFPLFFATGRRPLVTYIHHLVGEQNRSGWSQRITAFLEKISLKILRHKNVYCFTVSPYVAETLVSRYNFDPKKIWSTNNGLDLDKIRQVTPSSRRYDLIYCGRLHHRKGIFSLIKIMAELTVRQPKIKMAVIGDGPEKDAFINQVKQRKLSENIQLLGYLSDQRKYSLIKAAGIFILPSFEEGWGIVIAESLACGTPVVVSGLPEIREIWNQNVLWANQLSPSSFIRQIYRLQSDQVLYRRQVRRGCQFIKSITWAKILEAERRKILSLIQT